MWMMKNVNCDTKEVYSALPFRNSHLYFIDGCKPNLSLWSANANLYSN